MHLLPKKLRQKLEFHRLEKEKNQDLIDAQAIDVSAVETLCLALGPYRNLTTLSASLLFLHPHCQVLNHGGARIFGDPRLDFLLDHEKETLDNFLRYAIAISTKGKRGKTGGSIVHSHAFDEKHKLGKLYRQHFGDTLVKEDIRCLFWKESLRTSLHIRNNSIDLDALFAREPRLRFLLPVRNPLDCAISNLRTGHARLFDLGKNPDTKRVLEAILDEIHWVKGLQEKHPERFFYFLENKFTAEHARKLAQFLLLTPDPAWISVVQEAFDIDKHYDYPRPLLAHYQNLVEKKFSAWPDLRQQLLLFSSQ
ncbi:hypothetical protein [Thiolapillus sp.]